MPRILVNCHGGRVVGPPANPAPFMVPAVVSVHFYVADGIILPNANAWPILNHRRQGAAGNPAGTTTVGPGVLCNDYYGEGGCQFSRQFLSQQAMGNAGERQMLAPYKPKTLFYLLLEEVRPMRAQLLH